MFGMEAMSGAVSGLSEVPAFRELFIMFTNPILGLLAGTVLTCIIQSSSASVGILQALSMTGQITFGAAIPIVMGDAIGTCITAMLSSIGTKRDAKRAAVAHLTLNMGGALVWLIIYCVIRSVFAGEFSDFEILSQLNAPVFGKRINFNCHCYFPLSLVFSLLHIRKSMIFYAV